MKLRPYQARAGLACYNALSKPGARCLAVLPTGTGKTVLFASLADEWARGELGRVMVICPTIELVQQGAEKLEGITKANVAIEQASSWSNEHEWARADFIVACVNSLLSKSRGTGEQRYKRFKGVTLVIFDEAHKSITKRCQEMLDWFVEQGAALLGVTATPNRGDGKAMANVYSTSVFTMGIAEAIDDGWLVGCKTRCIELESLDLSQVASTKEDFRLGALGEVMEDDEVCFEIAEITAREMVCEE